ncbi:MAG: zf-HC2 domain-containing protein [Oscillospiraceae bacterium]|nr:zf-HC2 domain-containing protein [Oscillospiraceae bacterium]
MNNNNNNCELIRDLIPLYSEELCSDESKKIVEEHTKSCETCRTLLENLPAETAAESPVPDEGKAFRKVREKIIRSIRRSIILSVALAALVIFIGVLTVGECVKTYPIPSFTTVFQSLEVRHQVWRLFTGDIDGYMKKVTYAEMYDYVGVDVDISDAEVIRQQDMENIRKTYEAAYKDAKILCMDVKSGYFQTYGSNTRVLATDVTVYFVDGREVQLSFTKDIDGLYGVSAFVPNASSEEIAFEEAIEFNLIHRMAPFGFTERLLMKKEQTFGVLQLKELVDRFQPDCHEKLEKSFTEFYHKEYLVEDCILTLRFDDEKQMLYHEAILIASDAQGTAIMKTRLYTTYEGLIPPTEDDITIYTDGCTEELAENFAKIFG